MSKTELDDAIHAQIEQLSQEGDRLFDDEREREALAKYFAALELLPAPTYDWEAATWLYATIGDVLWTMCELDDAYGAFQAALRSPGGIGNPFVHLRVGQIAFEKGDLPRARDELMRAYMGAGAKIFEREHAKYFDVIRDAI